MMIENSPPPATVPHVAASASSTQAWLGVASVTVGAFAFVTTEFLPVGLLPQIAKEFGVLPGTAGLMVTIPGVLAAIAAPALMLGAGRIDRRHILILLSVLLLASNIISALSSNFAVMLIGRALLGASLGGFWTLALAAAGRLVQPHESPRATAMILAGVTLATVIGVPVGTFISELASWRVSFVATGVLAGVALLAQIVFVPSLPSKAALRMSDLVDLFRDGHSRRSLLMVAFVFGAHFSSYTFITPFLLSNAGFSSDSISWILLGFGIIGFAANFAGTALVARTLPGTLAGVVLTLMGSLVLLPLLQHSAPIVVVLVLTWGAAFGAIPLCLSVWMQRATADHPEAGSALFVAIIQVAIATGSSVGGVIVDRVSIPADFGFGAALALGGLAVLATLVASRSRKSGAVSTSAGANVCSLEGAAD